MPERERLTILLIILPSRETNNPANHFAGRETRQNSPGIVHSTRRERALLWRCSKDQKTVNVQFSICFWGEAQGQVWIQGSCSNLLRKKRKTTKKSYSSANNSDGKPDSADDTPIDAN